MSFLDSNSQKNALPHEHFMKLAIQEAELAKDKDEVPVGVNDKTSLLVVTKHESGALFDLLEPFKANNINMLQLARHPIPGVKWEYLFFIDIEGHQRGKNVQKAIQEVKSRVSKLDILGSYPVAVL